MIYFIYTILIILSFYLSTFFNKKINNFDIPGSDKIHEEKTLTSAALFPNIIFIIFFYLIYVNLLNAEKTEYLTSIPRIFIIPLMFFVITFISFLDDYKFIPFQIRLICQLLIIFFSFTSFPIDTGLNFQVILSNGLLPVKIDLLLSIFIWALIINVTNFIDGVDGMFSTKLIFSSIGLGINFFILKEYFYFYICLLLLIYGTVFIFFNFKKKNKSFIGDTGTIPIGFIIGWLFLTLCDFGYFFSAIMIILYYIFDIAYTLSVRIIKKKSIFVRHNDFIFKKFNLKFGKKKLYLFLIPLNILFIIISLLFNDQFIY
jgi:UDP-N-acetylmuramyl pentapeptide phosphotransferase/UDP-N-acetylglucosamine-1-phosphate transferase